jgi:hypothetical protein
MLVLLLCAACPALDSAKVPNLERWYDAYNEVYFNHELPDKIEIDHTLSDPEIMALTECEFVHRVCKINFNPTYEIGSVITREALIHEQCHIYLFVNNEYEFDKHGVKWQACMHHVSNKGGFEDLW